MRNATSKAISKRSLSLTTLGRVEDWGSSLTLNWPSSDSVISKRAPLGTNCGWGVWADIARRFFEDTGWL